MENNSTGLKEPNNLEKSSNKCLFLFYVYKWHLSKLLFEKSTADKNAKTGNKVGKVKLGEVKAYLDREMTCQARRQFSRDKHAIVTGDLNTMLSAYR